MLMLKIQRGDQERIMETVKNKILDFCGYCGNFRILVLAKCINVFQTLMEIRQGEMILTLT